MSEQDRETSHIHHYRRVLESMGCVIMLLDANGTIVEVSGNTGALTGYLPDALPGMTLLDLVQAGWQSTAHDGSAPLDTVRYPLRRADGGVAWVRQDAAQIHEGDAVQAQVVLHPAPPEVKTPVRINEPRFRGLFENNNDAVFFIDIDGYVIDLNQRAVDLFGYSRQEHIGKPANATVVEPEAGDSISIRRRMLKGENQPIYRRMFRRKDGSTFLAEVNIALVHDDAGKPHHFQAIVRDISERHRIEAQLEARIEQLTTLRMVDDELTDSLDMDYVLNLGLDAAMRLSAAHAGFIALHEGGTLTVAVVHGAYPSNNPLQGYDPDKLSPISRALYQATPQCLLDIQQETSYEPARKSTLAQIVVPMTTREEVIGILNLEADRDDRFNDDVFELVKIITRRISVAVDNARLYRQTQTQLNQLRSFYSQVNQLEQLKTDMIRLAAHDLGNPLATLIGHVELLNMDLEDRRAHTEIGEHIKPLRQSAERMKRIIEDILSLERIESQVSPADHPLMDLNATMQHIYADYLLHARHKHRRLLLDVPDMPVTVRGDQNELRQVISHFIENAINYTGEDGYITMKLNTEDLYAVVTVTDNGVGIPTDEQDKLFTPFYRVRTPETAHIKGTGLGLHLSKRMIERHKGRVFFESSYGEGSTFGFRLPLNGLII